MSDMDPQDRTNLGLEGLITGALEKIPAADKETTTMAAQAAIQGWFFERCRGVYDNEVKFHETLLDEQIATRMATGEVEVINQQALSELLGVNQPERRPHTLQDKLLSQSNALAVSFEGPLTSQYGSEPLLVRGKMLATLPSAEGVDWSGDAYTLRDKVYESKNGDDKNNPEATAWIIRRLCRQLIVKADIESLGGKVLDTYEYRGSRYDLYGRFEYPRGLQDIDDFLAVYAPKTQNNLPDLVGVVERLDLYCKNRANEVITCRDLLNAVA